MKKILIAGYEKNIPNYQAAFARLGLCTESLEKVSHTEYDGLVLPGGGDISPPLFGADNEGSRNIDEALDRTQLSLLGEFVKLGKPVLGICKGLQIINVYFGGTILQDLPEESRQIHEALPVKKGNPLLQDFPTTAVSSTGDRIHDTKAARGTFPELLYGSFPVTNSAHHQAIGAVGDGLLVAQYTIDFVVEAMYHKSLPVLGVQWHPERMCFDYAHPEMDDGALLLHYFSTLL